jgi:hypothetical protein
MGNLAGQRQPRSANGALPIEDEWTIADLETLPPGVRVEVHNGRLVIMSPARLWNQHIERMICNLLAQAGRFAYTQVARPADADRPELSGERPATTGGRTTDGRLVP